MFVVLLCHVEHIGRVGHEYMAESAMNTSRPSLSVAMYCALRFLNISSSASYDHLPFIDKRKVNNGYNKHVRGTYLHPLLIHPIAEYADMEYACRVMRLMHTINHENKLKNQMFEEKIEEIKDKHEKSIRGWNSERPGCIKIKQYVEDKCVRRFDLFSRTNS